MVFAFSVETRTEERASLLTAWEMAVLRWVQAPADFDDLLVDVMGDKVLAQEMIRGGLSLLPHLGAGLLLTIVFVMATVSYSAIQYNRLDAGVALVIIGVVGAPLLAVLTTFGVTGFLGIEVYPVQMVIPFLILAIGVDDAFLMLHAWHRFYSEVEHLSDVERRRKLPDVMAKTFEDIGPSITITSLTNAIAFGIGTTISIPAINLFCMAATVAMVLDFFFEIALFGSLLAIAGRLQKGQSPRVKEETRCNCLNGQKTISHMLKWYSEFLTTKSVRVFVMLFALLFFIASLTGTLLMDTKIDSQKIIPSDSPLIRADALFQRYFWTDFEPLRVFVHNPPASNEANGLKQIRAMVSEFESLPRAIGSRSTMIWIQDYEKIYNSAYNLFNYLGANLSLDYNGLPHFVGTQLGKFWAPTIHWHQTESGEVVVDGFYFLTGFQNATTWMERVENMLNWREVAERYKHWNVTTFSEYAPVFEGILSLKVTTIQTAVCTLIAMLAVCLVFVVSPGPLLGAAYAIVSISLGVFGFLHWWGIGLDPVSMSAIVMCIGFSVDYTAHVAFHYHRTFHLFPDATSAERIAVTLEAVGWPMIQAAFSTLLCFLPPAVHPDYTPSVFVRAIVLVVAGGVLHGLLLLPLVLSLLPSFLFQSRRRTLPTSSSQAPVLELPPSSKADARSMDLSTASASANLLQTDETASASE